MFKYENYYQKKTNFQCIRKAQGYLKKKCQDNLYWKINEINYDLQLRSQLLDEIVIDR